MTITEKAQQQDLDAFLKEVMRRRRLKASHLAADLGVSHATVSRWLSGGDKPSTESCRKLAEYSGVPLVRILSLAGHVPRTRIRDAGSVEWPEFGEYVRRKYSRELDEDEVTMIEDLIERRRGRTYVRRRQRIPR